MIEFLLRFVLPMGLTGSLAALAALLASPFKKKMQPWHTRLFLAAAALLFVLPVAAVVGIGNSSASNTTPTAATNVLQTLPVASPAFQAGEAVARIATPTPQPEAAAAPAPQSSRAPALHREWNLPAIAAGAYLAGVLIFFFWQLGGYLLFLRRLKKHSHPLQNGPEKALLASLCKEFSLRKQPPLYQCEKVSSPLLAGALSPRIVLPAQDIPPAQLELALRHELTHLRQQDLPLKWLAAAAATLHWYNPLAHWLRAAVADACEKNCDFLVTQSMSGLQRKNYAATLLAFSDMRTPYTVSRFAAPVKKIKERIDTMLHPIKQNRFKTAAAALALCVMLSCGLLAGCGLAAGTASGSLSSSATQSPASSPSSMPAAQNNGWIMPVASYQGIRPPQSQGMYYLLFTQPTENIVAVAPGTITQSEADFDGTYHIEIKCGDGIFVYYGGLSSATAAVGQSVASGDVIGQAADNMGVSFYKQAEGTGDKQPFGSTLYFSQAPAYTDALNASGGAMALPMPGTEYWCSVGQDGSLFFVSRNLKLDVSSAFAELGSIPAGSTVFGASTQQTVVSCRAGKVVSSTPENDGTHTLLMEYGLGVFARYENLSTATATNGASVAAGEQLGTAESKCIFSVFSTELSYSSSEKPAEQPIAFADFLMWDGGSPLVPRTVEQQAVSPVPNATYVSRGFVKDAHQGVDYIAPAGTPIVAFSAGVVEKAEQDPTYGNLLVIDHGGGIKSLYAHCEKILAEEGTSVAAGQTIATVGSSGVSTGNHCHFEILENETPVDPSLYLQPS